MTQKILITTHSVSRELADITAYTNRALIRVGKRPLISHIIESYPKDTSFLITLGHFGNQIQDFLYLAYPDRDIKYMEVKNYDKPGEILDGPSLSEYRTRRDTSDAKELESARLKADEVPGDLPKPGETIFIFDDFVIKFFANETVAQNRAERGRLLEGFVPHIEGARGNFYRYKFIPGELYSQAVNINDFKDFLVWTQNNFWRDEHEVSESEFTNICHSFYLDKTEKRVDQFLKANNLVDTDHVINGEHVPSLKEIFKQVDFDRLSKGWQSRFHGDFILDNILKTKEGYCFLDWRQDFGGLLGAGDRYYDFAKLNHNLTVNHSVVDRDLFTIEAKGKDIRVEIMRPSILVDCQVTLFDFLRGHKYDVRKVRLLTAIAWLNMAPLHHHPYNHFLYYFGKLHLWGSLRQSDIARKLWR